MSLYTLITMIDPNETMERAEGRNHALRFMFNMGVQARHDNAGPIRIAEIDLDGLGVWLVAYVDGRTRETSQAHADAAWEQLKSACGSYYWKKIYRGFRED